MVGEDWTEVQISKEWVAAYRLTLQDGVRVISELRIFPSEKTRDRRGLWSAEYLGMNAKVPRGGITARSLRAITIAGHYKETQQVIEWATKKGWHSFGEVLHSRPSSKSPRSGGRKRKPDAFYAKFAYAYDKAIKSGNRHPIAEIGKKYNLPREKVTAIVHEARKRKLLSGAYQGKPGGYLTDYARELLKKAARKR